MKRLKIRATTRYFSPEDWQFDLIPSIVIASYCDIYAHPYRYTTSLIFSWLLWTLWFDLEREEL